MKFAVYIRVGSKKQLDDSRKKIKAEANKNSKMKK